MIDIIITNNLENLEITLKSILNQINIPKIKVYIIDNNMDNYSNIIDLYKDDIDITYIKINRNNSYAKELGLTISNSNYLLFLDSGDELLDNFSLNKLYTLIENNNYDIVKSKVINNILEEYNLKGNLYSRNFLLENDIHFNETPNFEDIGFNMLVDLCEPKKGYIDESLINTNPATGYVDNLVYNLYWALLNAINHNKDKTIKLTTLKSLLIIFIFLNQNDTPKDFIKYLNIIYRIYIRYDTYENIDSNIINNNLISDYNNIKEKFHEFINLFIDNKPFITEQEKAKQGLLYSPLTKEDEELRLYTLRLLAEYNKTIPYDYNNLDKRKLLDKIFGAPTNCIIEPPFYLTCNGKNIHLSDSIFINMNVTMLNDNHIYIGKNVIIGPNVIIDTVGHPINYNIRNQNYIFAKEIYIEDNVWIGAGTIILPGVRIGKNSVIGAGSIVTKDIPNDVVAAGNPCKVIRPIDERDNIYFYKDEKIEI